MIRSSTASLLARHALLDVLYEAPLERERKGWVSFLQTLESELGSGSVTLLCMPAPSNHDPGSLVAPSLGPEFVASYRRHWFRNDPWLHRSHTLPVGEIVVHEGRIAGQPLTETSFYREWMAPQQLLPHLLVGGVVDEDTHRTASVLTVFQRRHTTLDRRAVRLLRELMPHLQRALRIDYRGALLAAERGALAVALNRLPLGAVVLDRGQRVRWTNRAAERLLARRDGFVLEHNELRTARPSDEIRLRRALADVFENTRGPEFGSALLLERAEGQRPLRASVSRVRSPEDGSEVALAVLFVSDPEAEIELPANTLSRFHGLTHAESSLVRELANGRSLQHAAVRLKITEGTARQRLLHVFEKTGTGRQSALLRLVLTGPESLLDED